MNYTQNYHLPQWEESDRVMRTDFNQMCADIENGLSDGQTRDSALSGRIDAAQSAADAAQQTALSYKHYAAGTYIGAGANKKIALGFPPSAVLISTNYVSNTQETMGGHICFLTRESNQKLLTFEDDGFTLLHPAQYYPDVNTQGSRFVYIAFR